MMVKVEIPAASRVLNHERLQLDGATLDVTRHMVPSPSLGTHSGRQSADTLTSAHLDTIEVKGIPVDLHSDYVRLFFESRKSGGGPVKQMRLEGGHATITFEKPEGRCEMQERLPGRETTLVCFCL